MRRAAAYQISPITSTPTPTSQIRHSTQKARKRQATSPAHASRRCGSMLGSGGQQMGERNVNSARQVLAAMGIAIVGSETGGNTGRTAAFDVATGALEVRGVRGGSRVL